MKITIETFQSFLINGHWPVQSSWFGFAFASGVDINVFLVVTSSLLIVTVVGLVDVTQSSIKLIYLIFVLQPVRLRLQLRAQKMFKLKTESDMELQCVSKRYLRSLRNVGS